VSERCEVCGAHINPSAEDGRCDCCNDFEPYDDGTGVDLDKCPYCRGTGYVTVTSAPDYQLVLGGAEVCEACDGEGHL
jgi:hypothetical protein